MAYPSAWYSYIYPSPYQGTYPSSYAYAYNYPSYYSPGYTGYSPDYYCTFTGYPARGGDGR